MDEYKMTEQSNGVTAGRMSLEQAATMALEALEDISDHTWIGRTAALEAMTALREALDHSGEANEMVVDWDKVKPEAIASDPLYQQGYLVGYEAGLVFANARDKAEQAEKKPVGYFAYDDERDIWEELTGPNAPGATPLYAAPQPVPDPVALLRELNQKFAEGYEIGRGTLPVRNREADRQRFTDVSFNRWLDEGVSDAGHTVWDTITKTADAWVAWLSKDFYAAPVRTKDLTDDEIESVWIKTINSGTVTVSNSFARAVIAADREKNK